MFVGTFPQHGPLDVCEVCWMIVPRTGIAPQEADPPACAGCGLTRAYGLTHRVDNRWTYDCPVCGRNNPSRWSRGPYVGTWSPDGGFPDEPVIWHPKRGHTVAELDADAAVAERLDAMLQGPLEWAGYTYGNEGTEILLDPAGPEKGPRLVIVYPNRGGTVIARLIDVATESTWRVPLPAARRARVRAIVEERLAALHTALSDTDLEGAINTRRLAQAWVRLAP